MIEVYHTFKQCQEIFQIIFQKKCKKFLQSTGYMLYLNHIKKYDEVNKMEDTVVQVTEVLEPIDQETENAILLEMADYYTNS